MSTATNYEVVRQLAHAFRRANGTRAFNAFMAANGAAEGFAVIQDWDAVKLAKLESALVATLPADVVATARKNATDVQAGTFPGDVDDDEGASASRSSSASAEAKPRTMGDIHDAAYSKWNSAKRGSHG